MKGSASNAILSYQKTKNENVYRSNERRSHDQSTLIDSTNDHEQSLPQIHQSSTYNIFSQPEQNSEMLMDEITSKVRKFDQFANKITFKPNSSNKRHNNLSKELLHR